MRSSATRRMMDSAGYKQVVWHVCIQWMAENNVLEQWLEMTNHYISRRPNNSFERGLPKYPSSNLAHTFLSSRPDIANYEASCIEQGYIAPPLHDNWGDVIRDWEVFYDKNTDHFIKIYLKIYGEPL